MIRGTGTRIEIIRRDFGDYSSSGIFWKIARLEIFWMGKDGTVMYLSTDFKILGSS